MKRALAALLATAAPALAAAYPGGTPNFVTDVAPFCTSCHSSVSTDQLQGVPEQRASAELVANKHIAKILAAREGSPYAALSAQERQALIDGIQRIDRNSAVRLVAPESVQAGQVIEVTVQARGGGGPVVGLALVDSDQRWQASPAPSRGWLVIDMPRVTGPDGQPQTDFTSRRNPDLAPALSYVNVTGVRADPVADTYDQVAVTWRLRAPVRAGTYPLAAAFLYGTEKASPYGAVDTIRGKLPLGGSAASSGRVRFSEVHYIQVK